MAETKGPIMTAAHVIPSTAMKSEWVIRQTDFDRWKAQYDADQDALDYAALLGKYGLIIIETPDGLRLVDPADAFDVDVSP